MKEKKKVDPVGALKGPEKRAEFHIQKSWGKYEKQGANSSHRQQWRSQLYSGLLIVVPSSLVTSQRPVRVGVSVESVEKDGCGTKGEVDKSQIHSLNTERFRRKAKRKSALACTSVSTPFQRCNLSVWRRQRLFPACIASSTDSVKSNLTRLLLTVRLTVKLHIDVTRN